MGIFRKYKFSKYKCVLKQCNGRNRGGFLINRGWVINGVGPSQSSHASDFSLVKFVLYIRGRYQNIDLYNKNYSETNRIVSLSNKKIL